MSEFTSVFSILMANQLGTRQLFYAADLAHRLCLQHRVLYLQGQSLGGSVDEDESGKITKYLRSQLGIRYPFTATPYFGSIEQYAFPSGAILITNQSLRRRDVTVFSPFQEETVKGKGENRILLPFGSDSSGTVTVNYGLELAAELKLP